MVDKKTLALGATLVVLLAGAGLRIHSLRGARPQPQTGACEHGGPPAKCFLCHPKLVDELGSCAEHGVPEALCTRCDPALIPIFQKTFDWCAAHSVPESQCVTCHPALVAQPAPPPVPKAPRERQRAEPRAGCTTHAQRLELASAEVVRQVGIATTRVTRAPFRDVLEVTAEVAHRSDRRAELSSRAAGVVVELGPSLGDWVEAGDVVARVESRELADAQADLAAVTSLIAVLERNLTREQDLLGRGVGTQRGAIEADTRLAEARAQQGRAERCLLSFGLSPERVAQVRAAAAPEATLEVRAPFAGLVVARPTVVGRVVEAGAPLVELVDTRSVWAEVAVPEAAVGRIALGQPVLVTLDALPDEHFAGRITWVGSALDRRTRTLPARAELENPGGRLRANLFGVAQVTLVDRPDALLVPRDAVQWEGCCNVVFVPEGGRAFRARKVRLGGGTPTHLEVLAGLGDGELVVSTGAFLLKTELLKGSIGAGCCEGE